MVGGGQFNWDCLSICEFSKHPSVACPSCHSFWPEGADVVCIDLISWQHCRLPLAFPSCLCPASGAGHVWQLPVLSCASKCPALAPFGCFWGHAGSWGMRSRVWKLLCTSVEAIPCVLEQSLHLCRSKATKIGVKTQAFAARSGLTVVISLAYLVQVPNRLSLTTTKKTTFLMDVKVCSAPWECLCCASCMCTVDPSWSAAPCVDVSQTHGL